MAKMCNCKRDFITLGRCCCWYCDAERKEPVPTREPGQASVQSEPIRQQPKWRGPSLRIKRES